MYGADSASKSASLASRSPSTVMSPAFTAAATVSPAVVILTRALGGDRFDHAVVFEPLQPGELPIASQ